MNAASVTDTFMLTVEALSLELEHFVGVAINATALIRRRFAEATQNWSSSPIVFSALQWTLLKVLFVLVLVTAGLIAYSWRVYGKVITEKFVRPSTVKEIEELKLSVAKLKLPREHTPRI